jgi:hemolysin activation/secretion protein
VVTLRLVLAYFSARSVWPPPLYLTTDSIAIGESLPYPVVRSRSFNLSVDGGFTGKTARTDILSQAATFDQTSVADVKLSASQSGWLDGVTAGSLDVAKGLSVLSASRPGAATLSRLNGDRQFTKTARLLFSLQARWW